MSANVISQAERDLAKIVFTVRQLCEGRSNAVGSFTLGSNVASTHITAVTCGAGSSVLVTPVTSTAATEYGAGTMYVSSTVNGSFYATHASNSIAARTFVFAVLG